MSTIYKYNNYILKPLTILHLEVNTVGLVIKVSCEGNHCRKSPMFPADIPQVQILVCFHQAKMKTCFSYNSSPLYESSNPCIRFYQLSAKYFPAANLFLMSENRYPAPTSSMSQPESVLPSLVNCTTNGEALLGPSDN